MEPLEKRNMSKVSLKSLNSNIIYHFFNISETRPPIKYVLDMTIAYPNGQPLSIGTLIFGQREECDIAVHYKVLRTGGLNMQQ